MAIFVKNDFGVSTCRAVVAVGLFRAVRLGAADRFVDERADDRTGGHVALLDSCENAAEYRDKNEIFHTIINHFGRVLHL